MAKTQRVKQLKKTRSKPEPLVREHAETYEVRTGSATGASPGTWHTVEAHTQAEVRKKLSAFFNEFLPDMLRWDGEGPARKKLETTLKAVSGLPIYRGSWSRVEMVTSDLYEFRQVAEVRQTK